jgi:hypothetical protein
MSSVQLNCVVLQGTEFIVANPVSSSTNVHFSVIPERERLLMALNWQNFSRCFICKLPFSAMPGRSYKLQRHIDTAHQKQYIFVCYCALEFQSFSSYRHHLTQRHSPKYVCTYCDLSFSSAEPHLQHMRLYHNSYTTPYHTCHYCPKAYMWSSNLRRHLRNNHK